MSGESLPEAIKRADDEEEEEMDIGPIVPGKLTAAQAQAFLKRMKKELARPEIQKSIEDASASVATKGEMARRGKLGFIWQTLVMTQLEKFGFTKDRTGSDTMLGEFIVNHMDPDVYKLLGDVEELMQVPRHTWWGFTQRDDVTPALTCEQAKDAARSVILTLESKTFKDAMRALSSPETLQAFSVDDPVRTSPITYYLRPITLAFGFNYSASSVDKLIDAIKAHVEDSDVLFLLKDIEKGLNYAPGAFIAETSKLEDSTTAASSDQEQLEMYSKPLVGKIVEISTGGVEVRMFGARNRDRLVDVDGQRGKVIDWDDFEECYVVHTFEGETVLINDEKNLELCKLPRAVEGGPHIIYPNAGTPDEFGEAIVDWLDHKGFCMIQMSESQETRNRAIQKVLGDGADMEDAFRQELESAYLGSNNITQVKAVPQHEIKAHGTPLEVLSQQIFTSLNALSLYTKEYFGYDCWATTSIWARVSEAGDDVIDMPPLTEKDTQEGSHVQAYERFVLGRKICILYMVDNAGGEIHLCPRNGSAMAAAGFGALTLPISANKMLIFRHDQMSYSYQPKGPSFALQAWMLTDIPVAQQNLKLTPVTGVKEPPPGENAQVMCIDCRIPGAATTPDKLWSMYSGGSDTDITWPASRFDYEPYWTDGDDFRITYKSYARHGAFLQEEDYSKFDNDFFGIDEVEANLICNSQRIIAEVGYACLHRAGYTRETLEGENIGTFFGDMGFGVLSCVDEWIWTHYGDKPTTELMFGFHTGVTAGRLAYMLDMRGPVQTVDTACSASLVALNAGHKALLHHGTDITSRGKLAAPHSILHGGIHTLPTPKTFIGESQAGMLSHIGRCFTFDRTADGFMAGEGAGTMFVKWSGDPVDIEERFACLVGSCTNEDGRSASLTAPNGPAQSDAIKRSMQMAELHPSLISVCECHGTGTALGDPIEIGALQGVMRGMRQFPLLNTSAKTNVSHLEGCAGACGVMKCVLMVMHAAGPPNCHLRSVNPNLITEGYPVFFQQELCDTTYSATFIGVSSFGFGGTNARADVYGRCVRGVQSTGNVWTQERFESRALAMAHGLRGMYKGLDKLDETLIPRSPISIIGSWDDFAGVTDMKQGEPGCFTHRVTLGDTRQESFHLCMAGDRCQKLCPAVDDASATAIIAGPEVRKECEGNKWLIDGRRDGGHQGTTYRITFRWQGGKSISWEPETVRGITNRKIVTRDYYVCGTWGSKLMSCTSEEDAMYESELVINKEGMVKFQFRHANDDNQTIYPNESGAAGGPDMHDKGKQFVVQGSFGEKVKVKLSMKNARISVSAVSGDGVNIKWQGLQSTSWDPDTIPGIAKKKTPPKDYFVCGNWTRWKPEKMSCTSEKDGLYECNLLINMSGKAEFQFRRATDEQQRIYPNEFGSVCGPDKAGKGKHFEVTGAYGEKMKLRLCVKNARISVSIFAETKADETTPASSTQAMQKFWVSEHTRTYYVTGSFNSWTHTRLYEDRSIKGLYRYHTVVLNDEPVEYKILADDGYSRNLQGLSAVFPEANRSVLDAMRDFKGKVGSTMEIILDLNQDDADRMIYHRPTSYVEKSKVIDMLMVTSNTQEHLS